VKAPAPQKRPSRLKVLVVEDEPLVRMVLATGLRDAGFVVVEAISALEALSFLATGQRVDAVFSDIRMPEMSGLELAARVRKEHPDIAVILTSADSLPSEVEVSSFVPKPYPLDLAVAAVRNAVRRQGH
jgi:two-component system, response regulator PdtaR